MTLKHIETTKSDGILTVTINRPESLNALNTRVLLELKVVFESLTAGTTGVILTGSGEKAFVAGADIKEMQKLHPKESKEFSELGGKLMKMIANTRVPVIAAVNGYALGGGLELALACDFIYCTENAQFALPEVSLGLIPCFGGCYRLPERVGVATAKEMAFTGRKVGSIDAYRMGLANKMFFSAEEMISAARASLLEANKNSINAIAVVKEIMNMASEQTVDENIVHEANGFLEVSLHSDSSEGKSAFVEKRAPEFQHQTL